MLRALHEPGHMDESAAAKQGVNFTGDDSLIDMLHHHLVNRTGKLRVSDAYIICGIEPGKVNQDQISRFGRAIRELGWERQRCRFGCTLQYAYVKGTAAEREVEVVVRAVEVLYDGLTADQCLELWSQGQRDCERKALSTAQYVAARELWSAKLRQLQQEAQERERTRVTIDQDEDDGPWWTGQKTQR